MKKNFRTYKGKSLLGWPKDYTLLDIETTGLSPSSCHIIEIGAVKVRDHVITDSFDELIQPPADADGFYVSRFITSLTGITNSMLEEADDTFSVLMRFQAFLGNDLILGYNVNFDVNFLYDGFLEELGMPLKNDFVDVLLLARRTIRLDSYKLANVTAHYGIVNSHAHRALSDCEATKDVYDCLRHDAL